MQTGRDKLVTQTGTLLCVIGEVRRDREKKGCRAPPLTSITQRKFERMPEIYQKTIKFELHFQVGCAPQLIPQLKTPNKINA
jgi:hypothetical protein